MEYLPLIESNFCSLMRPYNFCSVIFDGKCPIRLAGLCVCTFVVRPVLRECGAVPHAMCNCQAHPENCREKRLNSEKLRKVE